MVCECGMAKVDRKCPRCDVHLRKPGLRRISVIAKIKERERRGNSRSTLPSHGEVRDAAARVIRRGVR